MAYDPEAFAAAYRLEPPSVVEGSWSLVGLQTDRTRNAVDLILAREGARLTVFVERRVEGGTCLLATRTMQLSYYREEGCDDAEAARVVRALGMRLAARESELGERAGDALVVERRRTRPLGNLELRINRECNEDCVFCNTPEGSDTILPGRESILAAIDREHAAGHRAVTFTGREPTLDPALPEYVARARARGYQVIRVQTNGTGFAHRPLLDRMVESGMTHAEVSLHTLDAPTFASLVGAPRLLEKTLEGLRNVAAHPAVTAELVVVMTTLNLDQIPALIDRVGRELPHVVRITLSPMAPVGAGRDRLALVPRLGALAEPLRRALDAAIAHRISVTIPSRCGAPICAMPPGYERFNEETRNVPERTLEQGKSKAAACATCACDAICTGVWSAQIAHHGESELRPRATRPEVGE